MKYMTIQVKNKEAKAIEEQLWLDKLFVAEIVINGIAYDCKVMNT